MELMMPAAGSGRPPSTSHQQEMSWATLDVYILLKIFCRIPLNDLSWNISFVCKSWQQVCFELLFWNQTKLDLRVASPACKRCNLFAAKTSNLFNLGLGQGLSLPDDVAAMDARLMSLLRGILEDVDAFGRDPAEWRSSIYSVFVPCDLQLSDQHLVYMAERTPSTEVLVIEKATRISPQGISTALSHHWRQLWQIDVELIEYDRFDEMQEAIETSRGGQLSGVRLNSTPRNMRRKFFGIW